MSKDLRGVRGTPPGDFDQLVTTNVLTLGRPAAPLPRRMSSLPRYLALGLFVLLTALVALLAAPVWRSLQDGRSRAPEERAAPAGESGGEVPARVARLSQRSALALAAASAVLALILIVSLAARPGRVPASSAPFAATRAEVGTLAKLAESTAAQGLELDRERDVRRRAEQDAELKQRMLARSLDEKIRLGQDLHDGIIQSLYAVGLTLESVRGLMHTDPAEAERRLEQSRQHLNQSIRDVRSYIAGLTPANLRKAGFSHTLGQLLTELNAHAAATVEVNADDSAAERLSADQGLEALQIAREAVSNALRHGRASRITIRLHQGDGAVGLLIQDNGAGFDPGRRRDGGHGLANMHARAARLGATLQVTSQPGQGTRVVATLPVSPSLPA